MPNCCSQSQFVPIPPNPCEGCLQVHGIKVLCSDGPLPCSVDNTVDTSLVNDVSECDCGEAVEYSIVSFDDVGLANVSIDSNGVISFDTTDYYEYRREYKIVYKVNCPCNLLSATGTVYICMKNPCDDSGINGCHPCDGTLITVNDFTKDANYIAAGCTAQDVTVSLDSNDYSACDLGDSEVSLSYSDSIFKDVRIVGNSVVFKLTTDAKVGFKYKLQYLVECPSYGVSKVGEIIVTVVDPCVGAGCTDSQECDPCTGDCVDNTYDLEINIK